MGQMGTVQLFQSSHFLNANIFFLDLEGTKLPVLSSLDDADYAHNTGFVLRNTFLPYSAYVVLCVYFTNS